jgi:hypothetical protein
VLSINNDFLGYHTAKHNELFSGSDSEQLYKQNLQSKPNDWYYRTNEISYVRNNNGHRCKNIEDIDLDNYILIIGCSQTEGIGLKIEDTYPYLLSKKLNCDYYNLGICATGIDVLNYNLVTWFAKIKKPPKLLVVQWPNQVRMTLINYPKYKTFEYTPHGIWSSYVKDIGEFLVLGEQINFFKTTKTLTKNIIRNIATCPIIEVSTSYDGSSDVDIILTQVDCARDYNKNQVHGHLGVESNKINTEILYEKAITLLDKFKNGIVK